MGPAAVLGRARRKRRQFHGKDCHVVRDGAASSGGAAGAHNQPRETKTTPNKWRQQEEEEEVHEIRQHVPRYSRRRDSAGRNYSKGCGTAQGAKPPKRNPCRNTY